MAFIYIASPYTAHSNHLMRQRYEEVQEAAVQWLREGEVAYSPILHWHPTASSFSLPKDARFWQLQNNAMLACAKELRVVRIEGWETSLGVGQEIGIALSLGILITYWEMKDGRWQEV